MTGIPNMFEPIKSFFKIATRQSRSPLGIITLFVAFELVIVFYIFAYAENLESNERLLLLIFVIVFAVLLLICFTWLVGKHSDKLYGPGDFKNEEHFVELHTLKSAVALGAASAKDKQSTTDVDISKIADLVSTTEPIRAVNTNKWRNQILWVDDKPMNNTYEQQAFEAIGLEITQALSTGEAFEKLSNNNYAAIISDMERFEGPREGYVLLDSLRKEGDNTPLIFYTSSTAPEHKQETFEHDGQGYTNNPRELFEFIVKTVIK